jgi:hypothetical protein
VFTTTESRVITAYAAIGGFGLALVAVCLGAVSLGLHWLQREKTPELQAVHTRCDQLQLAQADMLDRIEHWTRRDRVRRLREEPGAELSPPVPEASDPHAKKIQLRNLARQSGVIR